MSTKKPAKKKAVKSKPAKTPKLDPIQNALRIVEQATGEKLSKDATKKH